MVSNKPIANAESTATFLALMGNERGLLITGCLTGGGMSSGPIAMKSCSANPRCHSTWPKPRARDLVETRRGRQMIYYSRKSEAARDLLQMLEQHFLAMGDLSQMTYRLRRAGEIIHKENANAGWPDESVRSR